MADPQPKVLNFTSAIVWLSGLTLIWSFITSPQAGAPTRPVIIPKSVFVIKGLMIGASAAKMRRLGLGDKKVSN